MRRLFILMASWFLAVPSAVIAGDILNLGDAAPPLKVGKWLKGRPIAALDPERTYVVEFWATWCGPCIEAIPHLTQLANKHKDIRFIGVAVKQFDVAQLDPFLKRMGDRMNYEVALDDVPTGSDPDDGAMVTTWLDAAGESSIPVAFIVHRGKLAWIGEPMELDDPLGRIIAGTYQMGTKPAERLARKNREAEAEVELRLLLGASDRHDHAATLEHFAKLEALDKDDADGFAPLKFTALCASGRADEGLKFGEALVQVAGDDARRLDVIFRDVVDPELTNPVDPRIAQMALVAMKRAATKDDASPSILHTLAAAYYRTGDLKAALATEEAAKTALSNKDHNGVANLKGEVRKALDRYRKAAKP